MKYLILFLLLVFASPGDLLTGKNQNDKPVEIIEPKGKVRGNILFLNGWNMPNEEICLKSGLCKMASAKGYRLFIPKMGKSIYSSQNFPETRADYKKFKKIQWITDTLLTQWQKNYNAFKHGGNDFIIGLSTGARGAALIAERCPNNFRGIVLLSGDYNQTLDPNDNLMKYGYGSFKSHQGRWKTVDNPTAAISKISTNVFIGHGLTDKIVRPIHSKEFSEKLKQTKNMEKHTINIWFPAKSGMIGYFGNAGIQKAFEEFIP